MGEVQPLVARLQGGGSKAEACDTRQEKILFRSPTLWQYGLAGGKRSIAGFGRAATAQGRVRAAGPRLGHVFGALDVRCSLRAAGLGS